MSVHLTGASAVGFLLGLPVAIGIAFAVSLRSAMWGVIAGMGVLLLMFVVAALPIKRKATREEVARSVEDFVSGSGGPWDWDDFISCSIADEELEGVRISCLRAQSEYPGGATQWCSEEGMDVLRDLAKRLRSRSSA
jgi:hypothetical protein